MSRELIKQLKMLKHEAVKPNEEWLQRNRGILLSQIKNTVSPGARKFSTANFWQAMSIFLPTKLVYSAVRPIIALLLIASMGVGGWIATVDASYEALPGDWLYPAKRATEKTHVVVINVVGDKSSQTKVHVELAKRRANEARKIVSNPAKVKMIGATVNELKDEINAVNKNLDEMKTSNKSVAEATKNVAQNVQEINDALREVKTGLLINGSVTSSDNLAKVAEAKDLTKNTGVKAVEVMVAKHLQGDSSISKDDVKLAINTQLASAVKDAATLNQSTEDVNKAVSVLNNEVKEIARESRGETLSTSTKILSTMIDEAAKQTQDAMNKTQQAASTTGQKVTEAKEFLSQDNLQQAMDVVREIVNTGNKAENVANNTIQALQNVLPVVTAATESPVSSSINIVVTTTAASKSVMGVTVISVSAVPSTTTTSTIQ
ncbi:MAG: DUF5667 domain-containing protein, partial [Patescibacteria group bacterium]